MTTAAKVAKNTPNEPIKTNSASSGDMRCGVDSFFMPRILIAAEAGGEKGRYSEGHGREVQANSPTRRDGGLHRQNNVPQVRRWFTLDCRRERRLYLPAVWRRPVRRYFSRRV